MHAVGRRTTLKVLLALFASRFDRRQGLSLASVADTGAASNSRTVDHIYDY